MGELELQNPTSAVIPAQAGTQGIQTARAARSPVRELRIPTCAGMTAYSGQRELPQ
jgi:hypothetical protein